MIVLEVKTLGSPISPIPKRFQVEINSSRILQMDTWRAIPENALSRFGFRLRDTSEGGVLNDPLNFGHLFLLAEDGLFFAELEGTKDPMAVGTNGTGTIFPLLTIMAGDPTEDLFWKVIRVVGQPTPSRFPDIPVVPRDGSMA
jgi:hypothetical protein